jgi:hypothetical protein
MYGYYNSSLVPFRRSWGLCVLNLRCALLYLHLNHQPPAALRNSRRRNDKRSHNDQNAAESPRLRKSSGVEDLARNGRADQQTDRDDCN